MAGGVGLLQSRRYIAIRNQESDQTVTNLVSPEGLHVNVNFAFSVFVLCFCFLLQSLGTIVTSRFLNFK